jgi:hypothetical protein
LVSRRSTASSMVFMSFPSWKSAKNATFYTN